MLSWGIENNEYPWNIYHALTHFKWTATDSILDRIIGSSDWKDCQPFILEDEDYINGYRVIYKTYINGVVFYTNNGYSYNCTADSEDIPDGYNDTGDVIYNNYYLSGFRIKYYDVIDAISFQFTMIPDVNCNSNSNTANLAAESILDNAEVIIIILCVVFLILCAVVYIIWKIRKYRYSELDQHGGYLSPRMAKLTKPIENALVAIITIGDYNTFKGECDTRIGLNGKLDLENIPIDTDWMNLTNLFEILKYNILPKKKKSYWEQDELTEFLKNEVGKKLFDTDSNELCYDGLIVCISGHGMPNHIMTSDYKQYKKMQFIDCLVFISRNT